MTSDDQGPWPNMPEYAVALVLHLYHEIDRVFWNVNQRPWNEEDPGIPGLVWRRYDWNADDIVPNMEFGRLKIRWYKRIGRGMESSDTQDAQDWVKWFDECLEAIHSIDVRIP